MKKYQKVLSVLFSSLLIFCAVSCANDSVEENTTPIEPTIDDTYTVTLKPLVKKGTYQEGKALRYADKILEFGSDTAGLQCSITDKDKNKVDYCKYEFELPKQLKEILFGKDDKTITATGIVLTSKVLVDTSLSFTLSNNGKIIKTDWNKVSYIGTMGKAKLTPLNEIEEISLKDKNNIQTVYYPQKNKEAYYGNWISTSSSISINESGESKYIMNSKEFVIVPDFSTLFGVELKLADGTVFGMVFAQGSNLNLVKQGTVTPEVFLKEVKNLK